MISQRLLLAAGGSKAWIPTSPSFNALTKDTVAMAYGGGIFVFLYRPTTHLNGAFRSYDYVMYSDDEGQTVKTGGDLPFGRYWSAVTYGRGRFVAIANRDWSDLAQKKAAYSNDGITWTESTLPADANWNSVAYGEGRFVAVSSTSQAAWSDDGITWTSVTMPVNRAWTSVTYGNGKFVAVGNSATATSLDGKTWTLGDATSLNYESVAYGNGKYIAITNSSSISTSSNGSGWTVSTVLGGQRCQIAFGAGIFIVTSKSSGSTKILYSSDTGATWQTADVPLAVSSKGGIIAYGANRFILHSRGTDGAIYLPTTMLLDPKISTLPATSYYSDIAYGGGNFVVASSNSNHVIYSNDGGIGWTLQTNATLPTQVPTGGRLAYGEGRFVYLPKSTVVTPPNTHSRFGAYSDNGGITWTAMALPSNVSGCRGIAYGNGTFVMIAEDFRITAYSTDGSSWTTVSIPTTLTGYNNSGIVYGKGVFVMSTNDALLWSVDGRTWNKGNLPSGVNNNISMSHLAYGNGRFMCISTTYNRAWTSTDGKTWSILPFDVNRDRGTYVKLLHARGKFIALNEGGTRFTGPTDFLASIDDNLASYNSATWAITPHATTPQMNWTSMAFGRGKLIAVAGYDSNMMASISQKVLD